MKTKTEKLALAAARSRLAKSSKYYDKAIRKLEASAISLIDARDELVKARKSLACLETPAIIAQ